MPLILILILILIFRLAAHGYQFPIIFAHNGASTW